MCSLVSLFGAANFIRRRKAVEAKHRISLNLCWRTSAARPKSLGFVQFRVVLGLFKTGLGFI